MLDAKKSGHRSDSRQVNFWVKDFILAEWDEWCDKRGLKRSALILQAVEKFLHDKSDNDQILRKFEDIIQILSSKLDVIRVASTQQKKTESRKLTDLDTMVYQFKKDLNALNGGADNEAIKVLDGSNKIISYCAKCGRDLPEEPGLNFCPDCGKEIKKYPRRQRG